MNTKHRITDADFEYLSQLQEIQKRNPPTSVEWMKASKEINALVARGLAGMLDADAR